eukprot:1468546-Heterocapsa_arctica.AAC.1
MWAFEFRCGVDFRHSGLRPRSSCQDIPESAGLPWRGLLQLLHQLPWNSPVDAAGQPAKVPSIFCGFLPDGFRGVLDCELLNELRRVLPEVVPRAVDDP